LRGYRHDDPFTQFALGNYSRSQVAARQRSGDAFSANYMHTHIYLKRYWGDKAPLDVDPKFVLLPCSGAKYADGLGTLLLDCAAEWLRR
jgi:hypothetical protein